MFKYITVALMFIACAVAKPLVPVAYSAPLVAAAPVLAQSSQVVARNYNGIAAAPLAAYTAPVAAAYTTPYAAAYTTPYAAAYTTPYASAYASPYASAYNAYSAYPYAAYPAASAYTSLVL